MNDVHALIQQLSPPDRQRLEHAVFEYVLLERQPADLDLTLSFAFQLVISQFNKKTSHGGARPGAGRKPIKKSSELENLKILKKDKTNQGIIADNVKNTSPHTPFTVHNNTDNNSITNTGINNNILNNNINTGAAKKIKKSSELENLKKSARFVPPTLEEVTAYCQERNNDIDPQRFIDHYKMRNWIPKGSTRQMADWKAAVRTWERSGFNSTKTTTNTASVFPEDPFAILDN